MLGREDVFRGGLSFWMAPQAGVRNVCAAGRADSYSLVNG